MRPSWSVSNLRNSATSLQQAGEGVNEQMSVCGGKREAAMPEGKEGGLVEGNMGSGGEKQQFRAVLKCRTQSSAYNKAGRSKWGPPEINHGN